MRKRAAGRNPVPLESSPGGPGGTQTPDAQVKSPPRLPQARFYLGDSESAGPEGVTIEVARTALRLSGLFPGGLSRPQREVLEYLAQAPDHTASLASLAAFVGLDAKDLQDEEAYLIRSRLMEVTSRGRRITEVGRGTVAVGAWA